MPKPPISERRRVGRVPMTLEEALRIEQQAAEGMLDLSVRGTAAVVDEAHRVHLRAEVWGPSADEQRRTKWVVWGGLVAVVVFISGLIACLALAQ